MGRRNARAGPRENRGAAGRRGRGAPQPWRSRPSCLVGSDIYTKLVKGYTEKQWGRDCTQLPAFIIKRLPVRYTYDNNYFNDRYQGIPIGGYNVLIEGLIAGVEVRLGVDYDSDREAFNAMADKVVYTGMLDAFYQYRFGKLEYRSLRFESEELDMENYQGVAVVNYTDRETPFTRIIEHKHFEFGTQPTTVITREYPETWEEGMEPYYPVNDEAQPGAVSAVRRARQNGNQRPVRRPSGGIPVLRYGQGNRLGADPLQKRIGRITAALAGRPGIAICRVRFWR